MPWRPGVGAARRALDGPYDDVPSHLEQPLWAWVSDWLAANDELPWAIGIIMRWQLTDSRSGTRAHNQSINEIGQKATDPDVLLELVEEVLKVCGASGRAPGRLPSGMELEQTLVLGNSAYAVSSDWTRLEMRVIPEVKAQVQAAADAAPGSAGTHLAAAWNSAYARTPDPEYSYGQSIKAVEAAAAPIVSPTNLKATLGTMIADIRNKPSKWTFAISPGGEVGVTEVLHMMSLLWDGQTSRHGGVGQTVTETPAAARAAVNLAATLVQWLSDGTVGRA